MAGRLIVISGSLVIIEASVWSEVLVSETTLASIREVRIPSPVGSFGRMICPDCSPPSLMLFCRMASATLESPTGVILAEIWFFVAQFKRP